MEMQKKKEKKKKTRFSGFIPQSALGELARLLWGAPSLKPLATFLLPVTQHLRTASGRTLCVHVCIGAALS